MTVPALAESGAPDDLLNDALVEAPGDEGTDYYTDEPSDEVIYYYTEEPGDEVVYYYTDEPRQQEVCLMAGGNTFEDFLYGLEYSGEDLFPENGGEPLSFSYEWEEAQRDFDRAVADGAEAVTLTGNYVPDSSWDEEELERWEAGLIQVRPGLRHSAAVHFRPADWVTVYRPGEGEVFRSAELPGTTFEEAELPEETTLYQTESPYEYEWCFFAVSWSREEYEAGMARCLAEGLNSFEVTGSYGPCLREAYLPFWQAGLIIGEGTPILTVQLETPEPPEKPLIYDNPVNADGLPQNPYSYRLTAARGAFMADIGAPVDAVLTLRGTSSGEYGGKEFRYVWNEEEFAAGMASGKSSFTVHGTYRPGNWKKSELNWWEQGFIQVADTAPSPVLNIQVIEPNTPLPFSVELTYRNGGLVPKFIFPYPSGASRAVFAFSPDGENWYEEEWVPESYEERDVWFFLIVGDGNGGFAYATMDAPSYYRVTVEGSAYAGETPLLVLNAGPDGPPDGSTDGGSGGGGNDDQGGDRGGGGQGSHSRPGREEQRPEAAPVLPGLTPPTTAADSAQNEQPELPASVSASASGDPAQAASSDGNETEANVSGTISRQGAARGHGAVDSAHTSKGGDKGQSSGGQSLNPDRNAAQTADADQSAGGTADLSAGLRTGKTESEAAVPASAPYSSGAAFKAWRFPGFAAATAATAAVILGCAGWLYRRGKRK